MYNLYMYIKSLITYYVQIYIVKHVNIYRGLALYYILMSTLYIYNIFSMHMQTFFH